MLKGRRNENLFKLLDPKSMDDLPEPLYDQILHAVVADLFNPQPSRLSPHKLAFARFALLAQSILGGICWPRAEYYLAKFTYGEVKHNFEQHRFGEAHLIEVRKQLPYPLFIHDYVLTGLSALVIERKRLTLVRNNGLSSLEDRALLFSNQRPKAVIQRYLNEISSAAGLPLRPTLDQFQAASRWLLTRTYPFDIIYASLGAIDCTAPPIAQIQQLGPKQLYLSLLEDPYE